MIAVLEVVEVVEVMMVSAETAMSLVIITQVLFSYVMTGFRLPLMSSLLYFPRSSLLIGLMRRDWFVCRVNR